jgi:hypothetical protein
MSTKYACPFEVYPLSDVDKLLVANTQIQSYVYRGVIKYKSIDNLYNLLFVYIAKDGLVATVNFNYSLEDDYMYLFPTRAEYSAGATSYEDVAVIITAMKLVCYSLMDVSVEYLSKLTPKSTSTSNMLPASLSNKDVTRLIVEYYSPEGMEYIYKVLPVSDTTLFKNIIDIMISRSDKNPDLTMQQMRALVSSNMVE